jgi:hypothetical protein
LAEAVRRVNEQRQENARVIDRGSLWALVWTALLLGVAVDPPFGLDPLSVPASVVGGAVLGLGVSRYFARQASAELRREAGRVRRAAENLEERTDIIMRMVQTASGGHSVAALRDEQGKPTGVHHNVGLVDSLGASDEASPETSSDEE